MHRFQLLLLLLILSTICQAQSDDLHGLWVIDLVTVGEDQMTPNARWTRFHADQTQESGNGRFQHSYGTWSLTSTSNELTIKNTNGIYDSADPFVVTFKGDQMIWRRTEEGQPVTVHLKRSNQLPETHGDRLLGLWELTEATGDGSYFGETDASIQSSYIFFRWDKRFVIQSQRGRINGVYNAHGHKSEVELIPYGEKLNRDFWRIDFEDNQLTLHLLNSE
ncbi:MAG: hypothetical protein AAFQ02_11960, partial [Bacteroidota bacterium]